MKAIVSLITAMAIAGCTDNRSQEQRDYDTVKSVIQQQLGKNSPYGPKLHIINMMRGKGDPEMICGYWDKYESDMTASYVPFAIQDTGFTGTIFGVGGDWQNPIIPENTQLAYIEKACGGKALTFPGFTKANM